MLFFSKRLSAFTRELCRAMDQMISGNEEPVRAADSETLFARISCRLLRLYGIMQENRRKVKASRLETGAIRIEKREGLLIDTLAMACSGIVYAAEKKDISVTFGLYNVLINRQKALMHHKGISRDSIRPAALV